MLFILPVEDRNGMAYRSISTLGWPYMVIISAGSAGRRNGPAKGIPSKFISCNPWLQERILFCVWSPLICKSLSMPCPNLCRYCCPCLLIVLGEGELGGNIYSGESIIYPREISLCSSQLWTQRY